MTAPPNIATASASAAASRAGAGASVRCPVCGADDCADCGAPAYWRPTHVAGVPIDVTDLPLAHRACRGCGYRFVHPRIPEQRLLECYRRTPGHHWGTEPALALERFYPRKKQLLEQFAPGRRVLDFGCYDGGFLEYLGVAWDRAGVEPAEDAARAARARGIDVIAPTVESIDPATVEPFDAVVIFDVMEHLPDPVGVLRALAALLRPGGVMLVETGDSDSSHFRRVGKLYPYCALVEHVGFFNRSSIAHAARRAGLELAHFEPSVHSMYLRRGMVRRRALVGAYWTLRRLRRVGVPLPARLRAVADGPLPRSLEPWDHFLAVLRKKEVAA
jgi:SAM-dependent methyltransferase